MKSYKKKQSKEKPEGYSNEIIGIIIFSLGILVGLSLYTNGAVGIFGNIIKGRCLIS